MTDYILIITIFGVVILNAVFTYRILTKKEMNKPLKNSFFLYTYYFPFIGSIILLLTLNDKKTVKTSE